MNMTLLQSFPDGLPVLDLHCDTAVELYLQNKSLDQNDLQIDLRRAPQTPPRNAFGMWGTTPTSGMPFRQTIPRALQRCSPISRTGRPIPPTGRKSACAKRATRFG